MSYVGKRLSKSVNAASHSLPRPGGDAGGSSSGQMTGISKAPADPVLGKAYANTTGAVAYLDEMFHHGENGAARFCVFTAVVVERTGMSLLREELREIAGGTFWHTTDELRMGPVSKGRDCPGVSIRSPHVDGKR